MARISPDRLRSVQQQVRRQADLEDYPTVRPGPARRGKIREAVAGDRLTSIQRQVRRQAEEVARRRRRGAKNPPKGYYHEKVQRLTGRIESLAARRNAARESGNTAQVDRLNERIGSVRDVRGEAQHQRYNRRHGGMDVTGPNSGGFGGPPRPPASDANPPGGFGQPVRKPALRNRAPARRRM